MKRMKWACGAAVLCTVTAPVPAPAQEDRPFLATVSAAAEEDDDQVWSGSAWTQRDKRLGKSGVNVECAFEPRLSLQFELSRARPRVAGGESSLEAEAELKWLYNNIARDGWGIGLSMTAGAAKEGDAGWRAGNWQLVVPFSWQWSPAGGLLHLNAGLARELGQKRETLASAGVEVPLARSLVGFAELARSGEERLTHAGVRWWLKRERYALDLSTYRRRPELGGATTGWVLNFNLYDL